MAKREINAELSAEFKSTLEKTKLINVEVNNEVKKSFIAYAMAVNVSRAIPDVRDGMKPVHRRILYAMHDMGLTSDKAFKKCAKIVGEVLGKYHPHGDSSVYDALVRLAQNFSINFPLVDGHGNFGSVDGDPAAAYRYTEARLSKLANEMLKEIDKNTVDFYPNFDDTEMQPVVLPSRIPNILVNGADGIAVGMATNIPPHNLAECLNGCIALMDNPDITVEECGTHFFDTVSFHSSHKYGAVCCYIACYIFCSKSRSCCTCKVVLHICFCLCEYFVKAIICVLNTTIVFFLNVEFHNLCYKFLNSHTRTNRMRK